VRLFPKQLLLLITIAAVPLAITGGAVYWRTGLLQHNLLETNAMYGRKSQHVSRRTLIAEARRAHFEIVKAKATRLEDFFQTIRQSLLLEAMLISEYLGEAAPRKALGMHPANDVAAWLKSPKGPFASKKFGTAPYVIYHLAPGTAEAGVRDTLRRLSRLGAYFAFNHREVGWVKSTYLGHRAGIIVGYPGGSAFPRKYDPRERPWYTAARKAGGLLWTGLYADKNGKDLVITCAMPATAAAVAAIDVSLGSVLEELFDLGGLPVGQAVLVDEKGLVRVGANYKGGIRTRMQPKDGVALKDYSEGVFAPVADEMTSAAGVLIMGDVDSKDASLFAYATIDLGGGTQWHYIARSPVGPILVPANRTAAALGEMQERTDVVIDEAVQSMGLRLLGIALLVLGFASVAAYWSAKSTTSPLLNMAEVVRAIGRGEFSRRVLISTRDEVGEMGHAVNHMARDLRKGKFVEQTFKRYVASSVVDQLIKDPAKVKLGGEKRELTVFFSDLSGFTSLSEKLAPEKLVELINEYLGAMTDSIFLQEGTLDKYEGDAVMAFWGAPVAQEDHARRACWAALDNISRLQELCKVWTERGMPQFDMRIGINTGPMIVGNMGSSARMEYTVMGDAVNTGKRLEEANKIYGTRILIGAAVREGAGGAVEVREIDTIALRGKEHSLQVFELLGLAGQVSAAKRKGYDAYESGLGAYRARAWDEAEREFRRAIEVLEEDKASSVMLQRVLVFKHHAPPDDWDGVFRLTKS
jgi:class 3 adenylate cyclase